MKVFETIKELRQQGFIVTQTPKLYTIVESSSPFMIQGIDENWLQATQTQTGYQTIFEHICLVDKLPSKIAISSKNGTLISNIIESYRLSQQTSVKTIIETATTQKVLFSKLSVGNTFKISENADIVFRKTGIFEYVNTNPTSLSNSLPLISGSDKEVIVMKESVNIGLSDEQKTEIVSFIEPGLDRNTFVDQVSNMAEDIPGLELLTSEQLTSLYQELYNIYTTR